MTFEELKDIIVETLSADADKITMEANLADDLGAARRFGGVHIVKPVGRQEGVVDLLLSKTVHFGEIRGVAGKVEAQPLAADDIADAFGAAVFLILCRHRLNVQSAGGKMMVPAACQRVKTLDDDAAVAVRHFVNADVIKMLVRDQNEIGRLVIAFAGIGVDIDHFA